MAKIEIRSIEKSDVAETVRMWRRSREGVQPDLEARLDYSPEDDLRFFTNILLKECCIWIAIAGTKPVGLVAINQESIEQLYVDPTRQRKGIGTALLNFAKGRSPERLQLHTHQANVGARRFYEEHGFQVVGFGISPAPENEPDVQYEWKDAGST